MNNALANIAVEQNSPGAAFRLIEGTEDMFDLNGIGEPIISVPARESVKFAIPFEPPFVHKKIKICNDSDDVPDANVIHETTVDGSCFEDIVVSDSDLSVIIIDE